MKIVYLFLFIFIFVFELPALTGWTEPSPITSAAGSIQDFAYSVTADKGTGLFSYAVNGGSANYGIYFKNSTENMLTWSFNIFLSTENNDAVSPFVCGNNGFVYNAWLDNNNGVYRVLFKRDLTGDKIELSNGGNCSFVNIFAGGSGFVHAVWIEDGVVYYKKGFNNGTNWSASKTIGGLSSENPFVCETGNTLLILWQNNATNIGKYSTSSDGGLTWSAENSFSSTGLASLSCAADISGKVYAVWEQSGKIYFRKYIASGWEMEKTVSTNNTGAAKNPSVAADTDGKINIVWSDDRTGGHKIYFSESKDGGVTFSAETVLSELTLPGRLLLVAFKRNLQLLYKEAGQIMFRVKDSTAPSPVLIKSTTSHPSGDGSNNNCPMFLLEASDNDGGTGVKGFSWVFDNNPATVPTELINCTSGSLVFPKTENGSWYLHVKAVDALGNWSAASHFSLLIKNTSLLPESEVWSAPNPVRTGQKPVIRYFVSDSAKVELTVFNEAGDLIAALNKEAFLGLNEITDLDINAWANGVYFYRLKAKTYQTGASAQAVKKILLMR
ncbi:MAG: hypothetical protein NTX32_03240 [Candidatus Firestonebacteria bacterium]|nr:hypothetical protein [Candidatus Firestonebacteria bacterium]